MSFGHDAAVAVNAAVQANDAEEVAAWILQAQRLINKEYNIQDPSVLTSRIEEQRRMFNIPGGDDEDRLRREELSG